MRAQDEKIKGFNILELIIVVVIIGVISAVGYPNFSKWRKDREARDAVVKIKNLPPTVGTDKITNVVKEHGFKWESTDEIFKKLEEEIKELKEAINSKNDSEIKNEFGDIYFTLLNLSNFLKINPESALQKTNIKFLDRFSIVEEHAGDNIKKQTPKDFQRLWQIAKQKLAGKIPKNK